MTDLEITRLCAEAMEHVIDNRWPNLGVYVLTSEKSFHYDPLHDDRQAMALVKMFRLNISQYSTGLSFACHAYGEGESDNLNRAICECVANMQATSARRAEPAGKRSTG